MNASVIESHNLGFFAWSVLFVFCLIIELYIKSKDKELAIVSNGIHYPTYKVFERILLIFRIFITAFSLLFIYFYKKADYTYTMSYAVTLITYIIPLYFLMIMVRRMINKIALIHKRQENKSTKNSNI